MITGLATIHCLMEVVLLIQGLLQNQSADKPECGKCANWDKPGYDHDRRPDLIRFGTRDNQCGLQTSRSPALKCFPHTLCKGCGISENTNSAWHTANPENIGMPDTSLSRDPQDQDQEQMLSRLQTHWANWMFLPWSEFCPSFRHRGLAIALSDVAVTPLGRRRRDMLRI